MPEGVGAVVSRQTLPTAPAAQVATSAATDQDQSTLERCAAHLALLADLTHADVALIVRDGPSAQVVRDARPTPVPSLYTLPQTGRMLAREDSPSVFRVLFDGQGRHQVNGTMLRGAPVLQEVFPVRNARGEIIAAIRSEMLLIEHERQRKRHATFRRAIARARDLIIAGRMAGGERLGRLGVHDGVMLIDASGKIEYISAPAEHLYRRLGYGDNLVKMQLQELETNEYICFRAMEKGVCLEQRVQEQDLVWIKRVVPLLPTANEGWAGWLTGRPPAPTGAIVAIQDVTDELRKEQELRIKTAMIQEIHHRVKNSLQTIAALLRLQVRRSDDPVLVQQLRETVGRILSIAVVHEFLSHEEDATINIHEVCNRILQEIRTGLLDPARPIVLSLEGQRQFALPAQQATSCALIVNELVQNAVEHAFPPGFVGEARIVVQLAERQESLYVEIRDNGHGLSTADGAPRQEGLGLQIVRTLVREDLKGEFALTDEAGVTATVCFPRWVAKAASAA